MDATYNMVSYVQQLLQRLEEVREVADRYINEVVKLLEQGETIHGIDNPIALNASRHQAPSRTIEKSGAYYELKPGNATLSNTTAQRTLWKEECLICGGNHHTNKHESQVVLVSSDLQEPHTSDQFSPRRVENFTSPGVVMRPQYYSDVVYQKEDGHIIYGNRMR